MFRPSEKQARALESRGCRYAFGTTRSPDLDAAGKPIMLNGKDGNPTRDLRYGQPMVVCRIIDNETKRQIARAEGVNHEEAFSKALAMSQDAPKPRTISETEAENVALKRRIRELESARAEATPSTEPEDDHEPEENVSAEDELAGLREEAELLGIQFDGRWRANRLRKEIASATSEGAAEIASKMPT